MKACTLKNIEMATKKQINVIRSKKNGTAIKEGKKNEKCKRRKLCQI